METTEKNRIYNVIILDKSGSMSSIARQAIDGVNETLAAIRSGQLKDPMQDNYVTLVAFCGCELRRIYDNAPIAEVANITDADYVPCCMTPLYDAVGATVTSLRKAIEGQKAAVAVTIITDGYENASREFSGMALKKLIDDCRKAGWMFAYIGADHDVESVAANLSIGNVMQFEKSEAGTVDMFSKLSTSRNRWAFRASRMMCCMNKEAMPSAMSEIAEDFFDTDDIEEKDKKSEK